MTVTPAETADQDRVIELYDELLEKVFNLVMDKLNDNPPKLGDFVKMFEIRIKSTPPSTRHKRFWKMLEEIRHNTLADRKNPPATTKPSEPKGKGE